MSENLDLVRSIYAALERGDPNPAEWADPEIEFRFADGPSPGISTGVTAMVERWQEFFTAAPPRYRSARRWAPDADAIRGTAPRPPSLARADAGSPRVPDAYSRDPPAS